jgi:hypothetical protein
MVEERKKVRYAKEMGLPTTQVGSTVHDIISLVYMNFRDFINMISCTSITE